METIIIVRCENCGNEVQVSPETMGNVAYWGQALRDKKFDIDSVNIEVDLLEEEVSDVDDVDAKLKEIRIDCRNCGRYICLDCE